jgi:hypothetical protein
MDLGFVGLKMRMKRQREGKLRANDRVAVDTDFGKRRHPPQQGLVLTAVKGQLFDRRGDPLAGALPVLGSIAAAIASFPLHAARWQRAAGRRGRQQDQGAESGR